MEAKSMENVCIVGAGFMGTQIGLRIASHGYPVWFVDTAEGALKQAERKHQEELEAQVKNKQITIAEKEAILNRIHYTTDLKQGASAADLVIEAMPEDIESKRQIFAQLDNICPSHTVLATNSSSLRISLIEDATKRPDKVLNTHFFAPVNISTMVELMRGTKTSDETVERVRRFVRSCETTPLMVLKESTGFIFNRIWRAIKKESLRVVKDGVATHEDVDRAWMFFTGMSMGPFGLIDMIGLDVVKNIEMTYYRESGDESDAPPRLLLDKIERGELGVKTGKGFYTYPNPAFENPEWLKGGKD